MGEPQTFNPAIYMDYDGTVIFEVETEGMSLSFTMEFDYVDEMISRLEQLKRHHQEELNER